MPAVGVRGRRGIVHIPNGFGPHLHVETPIAAGQIIGRVRETAKNLADDVASPQRLADVSRPADEQHLARNRLLLQGVLIRPRMVGNMPIEGHSGGDYGCQFSRSEFPTVAPYLRVAFGWGHDARIAGVEILVPVLDYDSRGH